MQERIETRVYRSLYRMTEIAPIHAASKTKLELTSNWKAPESLEAEGTGGTEDSDCIALFSKALASALTDEVVGVGCEGAGVARRPRESYDFGCAVAPAATV